MSHEEAVLIVDDNEPMRRLISRILKDAGFRSEQAECKDDALCRMERPGVSLVIIDLSLGGESGTDLLDAMRSDYPDMPVVFCSGYPDMGGDYPDVPFVFKNAEKGEDNTDNAFRRDLVSVVKREVRNRCRDVQLAETRELAGQTHELARDIHLLLADPEKGLAATRAIAEKALARDAGDILVETGKKPVVKWLLGLLIVAGGSIVAMQSREVAAREARDKAISEKLEKIARKVSVE